jgi:hypothetical protein
MCSLLTYPSCNAINGLKPKPAQDWWGLRGSDPHVTHCITSAILLEIPLSGIKDGMHIFRYEISYIILEVSCLVR